MMMSESAGRYAPLIRRILDEEGVPQELMGKVFGRISFFVNAGVRFVEDVPRTPSPHGDKVQRVKLREMALKEFVR